MGIGVTPQAGDIWVTDRGRQVSILSVDYPSEWPVSGSDGNYYAEYGSLKTKLSEPGYGDLEVLLYRPLHAAESVVKAALDDLCRTGQNPETAPYPVTIQITAQVSGGDKSERREWLAYMARSSADFSPAFPKYVNIDEETETVEITLLSR